MISIELWRARIGTWGLRKVRKFHLSPSQKSETLLKSILLACVICMLLVIGGVELNPGPKDQDNKVRAESEFSLHVPDSFEFIEPSEAPVEFLASSSRCEAVYVLKKKHFGKKRKKIFHGPSSKVSIVTGEFQDLELTTKAAKLDDTVESNARYLEFSDAQASASEKKITLSNPGSIEFAEMEIFVVGKDKPIMKSLA